jgi:hypothetical protein
MLSQRPKIDGADLETKLTPWSLFLEATYTLPLYLYIEGASKWFPLTLT